MVMKQNELLGWLGEWTFKERSDFLAIHKLHRYPATFLPELADKIISAFSKEGDIVLDLFSGTGTTLVEAKRLNRQSIGIELNPLAVLIARGKLTSTWHDEASYRSVLGQLKHCYMQGGFEKISIPNEATWFDPMTLSSLSDLIGACDKLDNPNHQDFFKLCVSDIIRDVSYCVHSGFKLHRDKVKLKDGWAFDKQALWDKLTPVFERNYHAIIEANSQLSNKNATVIQGDTRKKLLESHSVDLILTSPPYGDSKTTVAYGQYSALSAYLLGITNSESKTSHSLDADLLGGKTKDITIDDFSSHSLTLTNIVELFLGRAALAPTKEDKARTIDRLKDIVAFYQDLELCLKNGADYLKGDGYFVLVTSSRIVHDVKLHTDIIIAELGRAYQLRLKNIYYRDILNKRTPSKVNAKNILGSKTATMTEESIIVLQKIPSKGENSGQ